MRLRIFFSSSKVCLAHRLYELDGRTHGVIDKSCMSAIRRKRKGWVEEEEIDEKKSWKGKHYSKKCEKKVSGKLGNMDYLSVLRK